MSATNQILCLQRLQDTTGQLPDILQFLRQEQLIDDNQIKTVQLSPDHAKEIQLLLRNLQSADKIQLLMYDWNVLPVENIRISIITNRNSKEFTFNR